MYVDGAMVQVTNAPIASVYDWHSILIGADMDNGAIAPGFKGTLDEVRIYSTVSTTEQIVSDMQSDYASTSVPALVAVTPSKRAPERLPTTHPKTI
jgi:hypothetical protein